MEESGIRPAHYSIAELGIKRGKAHWNLSPETLAAIAIDAGQATRTSSGAIAIDTGEFTGRSPKDKFIVRDAITDTEVWWSTFNLPFDSHKFEKLYRKVLDYFHDREFFVRDAFVCADARYRVNLRVITEYAWSNLFAYNMFLRPLEDELTHFQPEWLILNAPGFKADPKTDGTRQANFSIIDFTRKIILIGGSGYTGEIKKGVFSALNFILPHQRNVFSMHCSANIGKANDTALFFGLSGTGKTTLSADPQRRLIGDDEHGWTPDDVIFNFEGGCYAKTINLSPKREPDIFHAIRTGALLENTVFLKGSNEVDYANGTKTENTRVSYPLHFIKSIVSPSLGGNPRHIFFLTCDAYGVLPPIARLTPGQAAFHFISGYTAKVAGTEAGITEPTMTFSTCFGAPFMPLHPTRYAALLSQKIKHTQARVWLVNTGWSEGPYGIGKRINLAYTRALISAALEGALDHDDYEMHDVFGIAMPRHCQAVPSKILNPRQTWSDKDAYDQKASFLAAAFNKNFENFSEFATDEIRSGSPVARVDA